MKLEAIGTDTALTLTPAETRRFARNARWLCSTVAGSEVFARFDRNGDLVDLEVDGKLQDVPADELNALVEWYAGTSRPTVEDVPA